MAEVQSQITYAGRRLVRGGKVNYAYVIEGVVRLFRKNLKTGTPIGGILSGLIEFYDEDGASKVQVTPGTFELIGAMDKAEVIAEWQAADAVAATQQAQQRMEKQIAKDSLNPLGEALNVIRAAMNAQRSVVDRAAFARYVASYIYGEN